jgi:competence protein ComGB
LAIYHRIKAQKETVLLMIRSKNKWQRKEQGRFLLYVGQLLDQGYSLATAIELVGIQQREEIRNKVSEILAILREGLPLHAIFLHYHFPKEVVGFLYFAEQHGNLTFAFKESGKLLLKRDELLQEFYKLIRYPILLCVVTTAVLSIIIRQLIPQFQSLYESLNVDLPFITIAFLNVINKFPYFLVAITLLLVLIYFFYMMNVRNLSPLQRMKLLLKLPLLKSILSLFITHYFAIQLSYLLKGGLSILDSLTIFEKQSYFQFFQLESINIKAGLREGIDFPSLLERNPLFAPELSYVVSHGLANGSLSKELAEYGSFLYQAFEEKFKFYFAILQPLLFSIVGVVILIMFTSVLVPMFHLLNSL